MGKVKKRDNSIMCIIFSDAPRRVSTCSTLTLLKVKAATATANAESVSLAPSLPEASCSFSLLLFQSVNQPKGKGKKDNTYHSFLLFGCCESCRENEKKTSPFSDKSYGEWKFYHVSAADTVSVCRECKSLVLHSFVHRMLFPVDGALCIYVRLALEVL